MSNQKVNLYAGNGSVDTITSTYAGEFAGKYISAALLTGKTLAEGAITIKPNVKYKEVVKKVASTNFIGDASCDFLIGKESSLDIRLQYILPYLEFKF